MLRRLVQRHNIVTHKVSSLLAATACRPNFLYHQVRHMSQKPSQSAIPTLPGASCDQVPQGHGATAMQVQLTVDVPDSSTTATSAANPRYDVYIALVGSQREEGLFRLRGTEAALAAYLWTMLSTQVPPPELTSWFDAHTVNGECDVKLMSIHNAASQAVTSNNSIGLPAAAKDGPPPPTDGVPDAIACDLADPLATSLQDPTIDVATKYTMFREACIKAFRATLAHLDVKEQGRYDIKELAPGCLTVVDGNTDVAHLFTSRSFATLYLEVCGGSKTLSDATTSEIFRCIQNVLVPPAPRVVITPSTWVDSARSHHTPYDLINGDQIANQQECRSASPDKWRLLVVCGETGIGKSAFVAHFLTKYYFREEHPALHCIMANKWSGEMDALNRVDNEIARLMARNDVFCRVERFIVDAATTHPIVVALHGLAVDDAMQKDPLIQAARQRRRDHSLLLLKQCMASALDDQFPEHDTWARNPQRESCSVTLAIDEIGKCLAFVRGVASSQLAEVQSALKDFGFTFVNVVFAGTGTDAFQRTEGLFRWSTDPSRLCLVTLRPTTNQQHVDAFALWACSLAGILPSDAQNIVDSSKSMGIAALWTNTRMAREFAKALAPYTPGPFIDCSLRAAASHALRAFVRKNGMGSIDSAERKELLDFAYWKLMRQSDVDTSLYAGNRFDPPFSEEQRATLEHKCKALGILHTTVMGDQVTFDVSPAIKFALCTNLGVHVEPRLGPQYEELCAVAAARGCEVSGYDTAIVKLSAPYPQPKPHESYMVKSEVLQIVEHLQRGRSSKGRNAVVVQNGPSAPGPDFLVLRVCHETNHIACAAVGVKNTIAFDETQMVTKMARVAVDTAYRPHCPEAGALYALFKIAKFSLHNEPGDWKKLRNLGRMDEIASYRCREWLSVLQESASIWDYGAAKPKYEREGILKVLFREDLGLWRELFLHEPPSDDEKLLLYNRK